MIPPDGTAAAAHGLPATSMKSFEMPPAPAPHSHGQMKARRQRRVGVLVAAAAVVLIAVAGSIIAVRTLGTQDEEGSGPAATAVADSSSAPASSAPTSPPPSSAPSPVDVSSPPPAPPTATQTVVVTSVVQQTVVPAPVAPNPAPVPSVPQPQSPSTGAGDLGLGAPIANLSCSGRYVTLVGSSIDPNLYRAEMQSFLSAYQGSRYLLTQASCPSFVQTINGNAVYAAYLGPFESQSQACAVRDRSSDSSYVKVLDDIAPDDAAVEC